MSKALRVLCLEDSEEDSRLLLRELRNGGYDPVWERVDTADAMSVALEEGSWDLVLADFALPGFGALAALKLVRQARLDLPFIVVSGVIGEEQAVAMMKAGAHDYVFKDNLKRLLPAIERELNETTVRRQRKRTEEALQKSEKKYNDLFDQSNDGILLHDEQGAILDANNKILEQLGYSRSEILNLRCPQLLSPGEVERTAKELQKAVISGSCTFETLFRRKNGAEFPVEISACRFDQEDHAFAQCIVRDITERKERADLLEKRAHELQVAYTQREQVQQELINSQRRLSAVLDTVGEGIISIDSTSTIVMVNQEVQSIWGYTQQELIGNQLHFLMPEKYRPRHSAAMKRYLESGVAHVLGKRLELEGQKRDGSNFPLEIRIKETKVGGRLFFTAAVRDITERKRAEEEKKNFEAKLQQAQKLESLGVLAGGIAHDFNNLLMGVLGNAEIALLELPPESPARGELQHITTAALRAAELTKQMLAYSGKGKFVVQGLNLSKLVEEMAELLQVSISKKVVLKYNFGDNLPPIEADASQIRQVVMNLIINASEAVGEKSGVVTVSTSVIEADRSYLSETYLDENLPEGYYVSLEVADTGCGMDEQTRKKIFDPFFTTKFAGRGLGLAAVLGILRGHGGAVKIYTEPQRGTTFKVLFPASRQAVEESVGPSATEQEWRGSGVILIVDDDEPVRIATKMMLEKLGFTVLTAEDGRAALEVFRSPVDEIVVVLLDLTMPHLDGEETFRELRRIRPDVRVILSSGYNEQETTNRFAGKGLAGFLQKPYGLRPLGEKIRQVLEAPPEADETGASAESAKGA